MKSVFVSFAALMMLSAFAAPAIIHAADPVPGDKTYQGTILPKCGVDLDGKNGITDGTNGTPKETCGYPDLVQLFKNVINYLIVFSTILATIALAVAGWKLLTSGGDMNARKGAITTFQKVLWGYLWICIAWLLVYTITSVLLNPSYSLLTSTSTK